jgi:HK97 family phage major capsid protein
MTLLEAKDKRGLLIDDNIEVTKKAEKEKRKLTDDEQKAFDTNKAEIESLEKFIEREEEKRKTDPAYKIIPKMEVKAKRFSFMQAVRDSLDGKPFDPDYQAIFDEGRNEFAKSNVQAAGKIILPYESRKLYEMTPPEQRAVIVTGQTTGTTAGGYAIQTDKLTVLPPLTNYLVLTKAGASYLTGLVGNVSIPTYSGTTVAWKAEVTTAADGAGTWGKVDLNPKKLCAFIDVSKMFLLQDSVGAEKMLLENLSKAIAAKLEATILGVGEGSVATEPGGLFWTQYTSGATTLTWAVAVDLEADIDAYNSLYGNCSYITNASGRYRLKTTVRTATYGEQMIMEGNEVNGYPCYVSNGIPKTTDFSTTTGTGLIFGNWADLIIGQWGGYDILIDPYTQAALGEVRILINTYFDAAAARTTSFSAVHLA